MTASYATNEETQTSCRLTVTGMDCGDCARTVESSLGGMNGIQSATVNFGLGRLDVTYDRALIDEEDITRRVKALGYGVSAPESTDEARSWVFDITGMDCGDCARTIEAGIRRLPGVAEATVNFGAATMTVVPADGRLSRGAVLAAVSEAGYKAHARGDQSARLGGTAWWRTRRVLETGAAMLLWLIGFVSEQRGAPRWLNAIPFLAAMLIAGYPVARAAWFALKARRPDMNVLMSVAAVGAIAIGRWDEGSSVLILFAVGLTLQNLTLDRTRRAIQALLQLAPREATVLRNGQELRVPVEEVRVGETVIVLPGERLPIDGEVLSGHSLVDQAPITGESVPVEIEPGNTVFAASINGDGVLHVRSTKAANDTTLAKIIHLVEEAQGSRAPAQAFVDRFAAIYTPIVVAIALLLATAVPLVVGDWREWIFTALVLLVVACPCALVISTPVAMVASIGSASRRGVLFKGGAAIEALSRIRAVAFDKTGTLTAGRPAVVDVVPFGEYTASTVLAKAAAVERGSSHPIAAGIIEEARQRGLAIPDAVRAEGIPGKGARAIVQDELVLVGSPRLFPQLASSERDLIENLERAGKTVVLVGSETEIAGVIAVSDPIRPASSNAVAELQRLGLTTVMLTGDNSVTAKRIAAEAGVLDIRAELLPEDKVAAVRELQANGSVAMIGDGVNDAPALATADVGIAMGIAGTDVAIEAADVALMGDELGQLPVAIRLARQTMAIIRQNIVVSLATKAVFLVLTFAGVTNLWLAVLADVGMSLLVTFNSLRLVRVGAARPEQRAEHGRARPVTQPAGD